MFFSPPNELLKLSATFTVSVFPEPEPDEPAALSVHWPLLNVAPVPPVTGPSQLVLASSRNQNWFAARA
ncbi:MAG: hypothetical protein RMJ52_00685 [Gemmataceae bacterium]|nr:hypothetical protein [Gemmataceae bacterium]MDW8354138.1 hypothetical protein [Bryobacterales bacterium]